MQTRPLESPEDLNILLDDFYGRVRVDPLIGPVFNDIAQVDWDHHIPKIRAFWADLLFGTEAYLGRPFPPHLPLGLQTDHFRRWLELFFATVDDHFHGLKADEIKTRAINIGRVFLGRISAVREAENGND